MQNFAVTCTDLTGFDVAESHADHPGKKTEMFIREELQHAWGFFPFLLCLNFWNLNF